MKQQAYKIRCEHPDWTDEQISKQLVIGLDATPTELKKQSLMKTDTKSTLRPNIPQPNDLSHESEGPITLEMIEAYIKRGLAGADVEPALVAQAFKLLEMKEKHSDNSSVIEAEQLKFDEVRSHVFNKLRSAPCDHPTTP